MASPIFSPAAALAALALTFGGLGAAQAHDDLAWAVSVGTPQAQAVVARPAPVVVAPPAYVVHQPVRVVEPVRYGPPVYVDRHHHHRHHHRHHGHHGHHGHDEHRGHDGGHRR